MSVLAWARLPAGAPGHTALKRLTEQWACLCAVGLDPTSADGIHAERLRKLAREGGRFTAQHLRQLSPLRRRATLVATVLDTIVRLTDDGVAVFDRAVGRMFRRAEVRQEDALLRDARAIDDKVRMLAKLGSALIKAKTDDADLDGAVATAVGWEKLAASVAEAERLARPDRADLPALAARAWPVLHRLGPVFLDAFKLRAVPAAASTLRAVELLHEGSPHDFLKIVRLGFRATALLPAGSRQQLPGEAIPTSPKITHRAPFAIVVDAFLVGATDDDVHHRDRLRTTVIDIFNDFLSDRTINTHVGAVRVPCPHF